MIMQNRSSGQDTDTPMPVYWVAAGITGWGPAQVEPFHSITEPLSSAAMQNDRVGQEMASNCRPGSRSWRGVQAPPALRTTMSCPSTMAQRSTVGQAMDTGTPVPGASEVAQGAVSADQVAPFHRSTLEPTTAVQELGVGQETPTRPDWYRAVSAAEAPNPGAVPKDWGASQLLARMVEVRPVLSTTAQSDGVGHDTAEVREPGWPTPGSAGLAGSGTGAASATGFDQLVPSPVLTWSEPSTITHSGPEVQVMVGRTGAVTGPVAGAG